MKVILAEPRGFCAGVHRAVDIVEKAIEKFGKPIYVRHEIVHNKYVVEDLRQKGAVFVKELDEVPVGAVTIFSAHGVSRKVESNAQLKELQVLDATCPLVKKVHNETVRYDSKGKEIILIGHKGHPEVEGTSGRVDNDIILVSEVLDVDKIKVKNPDNLAYVTQTTLSLDDTKDIIKALKVKFPNITGPDTKDICYATQNRQEAVRELSKQVDIMLVIGAENSSNSNRLRDLAEQSNIDAYLITGAKDINPDWLKNVKTIGITAGASAPEILVEQVVEGIKKFGVNEIALQEGKKENVKFKLPKELISV